MHCRIVPPAYHTNMPAAVLRAKHHKSNRLLYDSGGLAKLDQVARCRLIFMVIRVAFSFGGTYLVGSSSSAQVVARYVVVGSRAQEENMHPQKPYSRKLLSTYSRHLDPTQAHVDR